MTLIPALLKQWLVKSSFNFTPCFFRSSSFDLEMKTNFSFELHAIWSKMGKGLKKTRKGLFLLRIR